MVSKVAIRPIRLGKHKALAIMCIPQNQIKFSYTRGNRLCVWTGAYLLTDMTVWYNLMDDTCIYFSQSGVTAVIKAICAEPCLNKCPPKNLEFWHKLLGRKISNLLENINLLPLFSPKNSLCQAKSWDSPKNFFLQKQPFLELAPLPHRQ